MAKVGPTALLALLALGGLERSTWAQSRAAADECIEAHVDGQRYVKERKLRDAAAQFEQCAADHCPKVVRRDCGKLVTETRAQIPSIVVDVSDHQGQPITDATIVIDGKAVDAKSGEALELDPGKHWARVISKQGRSVEVTFDLEPGERDVRVKATLPAPAKPAPPPPPQSQQQASGIPPATWVSGAVAIVGFVGFALFALSGSGKESDLDACKPDCNDRSVYDDMKRDYLIADVSLGIAVVAAGLGAYFYISRDDGSEAPVRSAWARPRALNAGGALDFGLSF